MSQTYKLKPGRPADSVVMDCPSDVNPDDDSVRYYGGLLVCESASDSQRRRIVACWNACDGISTSELEEIASTGGMLGPREDVARIAKQRDALLEALEELVAEFGVCGLTEKARAAIAKATGEQA